MIEAVAVVVPVHDEEALLPDCLAALAVALAAVPVATRTAIVLDACTDRSAELARAWIAADPAARLSVEIIGRRVGTARALGARCALQSLGSDPARTWLATTDADSRVPPDWLVVQLAHAADGVEAIAGAIRVDDWSEYPHGLGEAFARFYEPEPGDDAHAHVHGANLGVRADAYLAAGGFADLATGEDHALWGALSARRRLSSRRLAVTTSARRRARAPAGFSEFLARFAVARGSL